MGTALSRITGLLRIATLAAALGVTSLADAYNTANTVPNVLLMLVTGGTLSSVLIPMLARSAPGQSRYRTAETIGAVVLGTTLLASVATLLAAPLLIRVFAAGRVGDPTFSHFARVATDLLMVFAPQIFFYGLSVYAVAVLNAHGRLAAAGFAPIATNVITIVAIYTYMEQAGRSSASLQAAGPSVTWLLGVGTTLGVAAMAGIQFAAARRLMPGLRPRLSLRDPLVGRLWELGRWTFLYVIVNQIGLAVVVALANSVAGGVTAYQWGFTIMQLPHAIIAVSILSGMFPRLARDTQDEAFAATFARTLRYIVVLVLPAAAGLLVLSRGVTEIVLGYGAASEQGTSFVAPVVMWFAMALLPFSVFQLLTRAHYAFGDTKTPALVNIVVNAVNIAGAVVVTVTLDEPSTISGLAAAYGASYVVGTLLLSRHLVRKRSYVFNGVARSLMSSVLASLGMGGVLLGLMTFTTNPHGFASTVMLVFVGAGVYVSLGLLLGNAELRSLGRALVKRIRTHTDQPSS